MHRPSRCLTLLCLLSLTAPSWAQSSSDSAKSSASAKPAHHAASRLDLRLRLGDGVNTWHPTRRQIGVAYATGNDQAAPGAFQFKVNRAKLRHYLNAIAPYVRRAPRDARPVVASPSSGDDGARPVKAKILPSVDGAVLNVDAAVDAVQKAVEAKPDTVHVILPVKTKSPDVTTADLKGIDARIGYFVTRFNPGDVGRTMTVRHAIDIIDGHVVMPGAVFSINEIVGERTPANGFYGKGHVFINGKMEVQAGGGMCQVATTLFNAAMLADLKIVERHQHVRTIPYADPGRDATVYWGQKDFKFQNDTGAPVYVSYKTTRSRAVVSLFGHMTPGKKVKLVSHYRRLGERHYTGTFYRVVYEPDGQVRKDPPFYSAYKWTEALDYNR